MLPVQTTCRKCTLSARQSRFLKRAQLQGCVTIYGIGRSSPSIFSISFTLRLRHHTKAKFGIVIRFGKEGDRSSGQCTVSQLDAKNISHRSSLPSWSPIDFFGTDSPSHRPSAVLRRAAMQPRRRSSCWYDDPICPIQAHRRARQAFRKC